MLSISGPVEPSSTPIPSTRQVNPFPPKVFGAFVGACALVSILVFLHVLWAFLPASFSSRAKPLVVQIESGLSSRAIAHKLRAAGVIRSEWAFWMLSRLWRLDKELQAGTYELSPGASPYKLILSLVRGDSLRIRLTIPEGKGLEDIADKIAALGLGDKGRFLTLARGEDESFRPRVRGIEFRGSLEGCLFPDTYEFCRGYPEEKIILAMVERFCQVVLPEYARYRKSLGNAALPLRDLIILASLIEREAKLDRERPLIASVFYNRLRAGMPLQSCASVEYALGQHKDALTYEDLKVDSPYNTYLHKGLPPGPIANPGLASIRAAMYPATTDYLYFVSNGDGSHSFSKDYKHHLLAQAAKRRK